MNKVVTVNLNGRAYQIEEHGYNLLTRYLGQAEAQLAGNPDRDEIIADFEQAIAEKCDQLLSETKTVIGSNEVAAIIDQMGPVDGKEEAQSHDEPVQKPTKRLYLIKEGSIIGGVCNGIAAYTNVDVTVIRVLTVILAFATSGAAAAVYLIMMVIVPEARTPEEKAAAQGTSFNSKALLETAKQKYAVLSDEKHWKDVAERSRPAFKNVGSAIRLSLRAAAGVVATLGLISLLALVTAGISGSWTLLIDHTLFGQVIFDPTISTSLFAVLLASGVVIAAVPLFLITIVFYRYAKHGSSKQNIWTVVSALTVFAIALGVAIAILTTNPAMRTNKSYYRTHGDTSAEILCIGTCSQDQVDRMSPTMNNDIMH